MAGKGVTFEQYDVPSLKTDEIGVADMGTERAVQDPEGNLLSLRQLRH